MINLFAITFAFFNTFFPLPPNYSSYTPVELQDGQSTVQVNGIKQIGNTYTNAKMTCYFYGIYGNGVKLLSQQEHVYSCSVNIKLDLPTYLLVRMNNEENVQIQYNIQVNHQ